MKKYEAYKNSGIEWIGEIPEGWDVQRLKFFGSLYGGLAGKSREDFDVKEGDEYALFVPFTNIFNNNILNPDLMQKVKVSPNESQNKVSKGDILFLMSSEDYDGIGKSSILDTEFDTLYLNSFCKGFKVLNENMFPYFLNYYLLGNSARYQIRRAANGFTRINLKMGGLLDTMICFPPLSEQQAIASYLDHKVGQIDASVSAINSQIEDLKAYRQSIISEAVTKGLDKNVKMKDSGVEWIGEIPEGWECTKIKYILDNSKDGIKIGPFGSSLTGKVDNVGEYKVYGQWNIVGRDFSAGKNYVSEDTYESLESYQIVSGDILISMMGTVGKCAIIPVGIVPGIMDSHVVKARLNQDRIIPSYFAYVYDKDNSNVVYSQIQKYRRGSIMDGLNSTLIKEFDLPIPPLSEQQAIANYLDSKTSKIDSAIKSLEAQRDDLNALKQSIISEAVTGKIDVRDWNLKK